jgi:hypothetical protein
VESEKAASMVTRGAPLGGTYLAGRQGKTGI